MNNNKFNEHSLYLLVDGQLDSATKKKLMEKIDASPELKQKFAEISRIKELISLAYVQERPGPARVSPKSEKLSHPLLVSLAASLIMALGVTLGWMTHQQYASSIPALASTNNSTVASTALNSVDAGTLNVRKFIIHVEFLDESQFEQAIVETSSILDAYASVDLPVQMELVFNMQAVRMFQPQHIGQAQKVKALIGRHENLKLYACSKSLNMFLGDMENPPEMSAFHTNRIVEEMIPERISQGWVYIKV